MQLRVSGLGPLREAAVELDAGLTVLVGPNGSGKTWLLTALAAAVDVAHRNPVSAAPLLDQARERLDHAARAAGEPVSVGDLALRVADHDLARAAQELPRWVGVGEQTLGSAKLELVGLPVEHMSLVASGDRFLLELRDGPDSSARLDLGPLAQPEPGRLLLALQQALSRAVDVHPVDRVALDTFLISELRANRPDPFAERWAAVLGSPPAHRLALLVELHLQRRLSLAGLLPTEAGRRLSAGLGRLLGGRIELDPQGVASHVREGAAEAIPVSASPSLVRSLAGPTVSLQRALDRPSYLIIDEPELGLHPEAQVTWARDLIAIAASSRLRVVVATHSDHMLREFSMFAAMKNAGFEPERIRERLGAPPELPFGPLDLRVYDLEPGLARELPSGKYGLSFPDRMTKVVEGANDRGLQLDAEIYGGEVATGE